MNINNWPSPTKTNIAGWFLILALQLSLDTTQAATISTTVGFTSGALGGGSCGPRTSDIILDTGPISVEHFAGDSVSPGRCEVAAVAYADAGVVGIAGNVSQFLESDVGTMAVGSFASVSISDIRLEAAPGHTLTGLIMLYGDTIEIGLNAALTGVVSTELSTSSQSFVRSAEADLRGGVEIRSGSITNGLSFFEAAMVADGPNVSINDSGNINIPLAPTISANVSQPIRVTFRLNGDAQTAGHGDAFANANYSADNSLGFSPTGPAFFLPEGFTVNAPEVGIIDNQWIDPRVAPVPIPLTGLLLLSGLCVLGVAQENA